MRNRILVKGVDPARVIVIRGGAEISNGGTAPAALDQSVIAAIRANFRFVLLHAGNLGFYGAWDTLVEGAQQLSADGIGLVFVGDGAERKRLETACAGISNVRFLPFFPASKIPSVLAAADAHVITVKRGLEGVVVPSKMYGILAAGKPILAVAPAECDVVSIGSQKGFSISADPDNPAQLVDRVREILFDGEKLHRLGVSAAATAPEYERGQELAKLVKVLEETG